jgi:hypothetical protein
VRPSILGLVSVVLLVFSLPLAVKADSPPNIKSPEAIGAEDRLNKVLNEILKRLDSIEMRLTTMEQELARPSHRFSGDVERAMQLDSYQLQRRIIKPLEETMAPMER